MALKLDRYFREEYCPFTKRRAFKKKNIQIALTIAGVVLIGMVLAFNPEPADKDEGTRGKEASSNRKNPSAPEQNDPPPDPYADGSHTKPSKPARQYSASQVVRREGGTASERLPMGTTIPAKLINTVLSSDSNSPVIAEIVEDTFWKGVLTIPAGTRAIGQGVLDDGTERLQVRFQTLVFPDGEQHSLSALALLGDGSSGIPGNYHSGAFKKQAGRFFGNFVGGLAEGMKDKDSRGQSGIVFEPGSLKNGILNGLASSSFDQAKSLAESPEGTRPYLDIPAGAIFLLYLEKELSI